MKLLQDYELEYIDSGASDRAKSVILGGTRYVLHKEGELRLTTYEDDKTFLVTPDEYNHYMGSAKLLQPHEWEYLQNEAVNKTEAVCWPDGWMIHPDRESAFVVRDVDDDKFLLTPTEEDDGVRFHRVKYIWKHDEGGFITRTYDKLRDLFVSP